MKRYFWAVLCGLGILTIGSCSSMQQETESPIKQEESQTVQAKQEESQAVQTKQEESQAAKRTGDAKEDLEEKTAEAESEAGKEETKESIKEEAAAENTQERNIKEEATEKAAGEEGNHGTEPVEDFPIPEFYGSWKGKDSLACSTAALSQQEIQDFLAYKVTYEEDGFFQNGTYMETENFGYEFEFLTQRELEEDFRVDLSQWRQGDKKMVYGMISDLADEFGKYFYVTEKDQLWIYYEGVFFRMERTGS